MIKKTRLGSSQRKVLNYLNLHDGCSVSLKTIGEQVGGKDLTGRSLRGSSWTCQVLRPLLKHEFVEKTLGTKNKMYASITEKGIKFLEQK